MSTSSNDDGLGGSVPPGPSQSQLAARNAAVPFGNGKLHGAQASRTARDMTSPDQAAAIAGVRDVRDAVPGSSATEAGRGGGTP